MSRDLTGALTAWLAEGSRQMGEVLIRAAASGYELLHQADAGHDDLETRTSAEEARHLALETDDGQYRPLKTAPNLRRGWRLLLGTAGELRHALDLFYPAMLGIFLDFERGNLDAVTLRETLDRQTGMYAVTRKLTDEQAQALIGRFCTSDGGCLKTILWRISPDLPVSTLPLTKFNPSVSQTPVSLGCPLPMLCHEACNLLVAETRAVVKSAPVT